ncbi:hypothetical protein SSP35_07_01870 [Streptomyces sp. NBRC 110611]|uniref:hypothetical protein n=1 Tax=Streptomyces sp. NBRC 110611 TaxID=1621259 RepID=UPI0008571674|nr:hypothetical protein [Streptomyces sp. NBRC 110611]GAU68385.1 hypothetical protein SSP35_07_01870 [Streptomyces sp. NBRC 110611]
MTKRTSAVPQGPSTGFGPGGTPIATALRALAAGTLAIAVVGVAPYAASAAPVPAPHAPARASVDAAHEAATAPATLDTLSRFFATDRKRSGGPQAAPGARAAAPGTPQDAPHIEGGTVPVYTLSPDFVRGTAGAPVARVEFLASRAVAADGRTASVWTARKDGAWKVVNIASGDDETRYVAAGAARDASGTVFHEPQTDAWYLLRGDRVEPLDADARKAVGAHGTTLAAYQKRVAKAYGDKLPGSAYDKRGEAGGYGPETGSGSGAGGPAAGEPPVAEERAAAATAGRAPAEAGALAADGFPVTAATTVAGAAALLALGLSATVAVRRRRSDR